MKTIGYTEFDPGPMSLESQLRQIGWVFHAPDIYIYNNWEDARERFGRDADLDDDTPCVVWADGIDQHQVMFEALRLLHVHHLRYISRPRTPSMEAYEYMRWVVDLYLAAGMVLRWDKPTKCDMAELDPRALGDPVGCDLRPVAPDRTDVKQWQRMTKYPSNTESPPEFSWDRNEKPIPADGGYTGVVYSPITRLSNLRNLPIYPAQRMSQEQRKHRVYCRPLPTEMFPYHRSNNLADHTRRGLLRRVIHLIKAHNIPVLRPIIEDTKSHGGQAEHTPSWGRFMAQLTQRAMGIGTLATDYCVDKDAPIYKLERKFGMVVNNLIAAPDFFPVQSEYERALKNEHRFADEEQKEKFTAHVLANELEEACALIKL